jgi:Fe-S cluster assembly protein SufD
VSGKGWLAAARGEALARLTAMGLPGRRDEYWRYTDPSSLNAPEAPRALRFDASDEAAPFDGMDRVKIVFVDGVFDAAASDDLALPA